jgi:hypothetical protein
VRARGAARAGLVLNEETAGVPENYGRMRGLPILELNYFVAI